MSISWDYPAREDSDELAWDEYRASRHIARMEAVALEESAAELAESFDEGAVA